MSRWLPTFILGEYYKVNNGNAESNTFLNDFEVSIVLFVNGDAIVFSRL
jgi:hypothetical protein